MTRCDEIQAELSAYLDGEVPADERAVLDSHLRDCSNCRALLTELDEIRRTISTLPKLQAPATLAARIRQEVAAVDRETSAESAASLTPVERLVVVRRSFWMPTAFALAALIMLSVMVFLVLPRLAENQNTVATAPVPPPVPQEKPQKAVPPAPPPAVAVPPVAEEGATVNAEPRRALKSTPDDPEAPEVAKALAEPTTGAPPKPQAVQPAPAPAPMTTKKDTAENLSVPAKGAAGAIEEKKVRKDLLEAKPYGQREELRKAEGESRDDTARDAKAGTAREPLPQAQTGLDGAFAAQNQAPPKPGEPPEAMPRQPQRERTYKDPGKVAAAADPAPTTSPAPRAPAAPPAAQPAADAPAETAVLKKADAPTAKAASIGDEPERATKNKELASDDTRARGTQGRGAEAPNERAELNRTKKEQDPGARAAPAGDGGIGGGGRDFGQALEREQQGGRLELTEKAQDKAPAAPEAKEDRQLALIEPKADKAADRVANKGKESDAALRRATLPGAPAAGAVEKKSGASGEAERFVFRAADPRKLEDQIKKLARNHGANMVQAEANGKRRAGEAKQDEAKREVAAQAAQGDGNAEAALQQNAQAAQSRVFAIRVKAGERAAFLKKLDALRESSDAALAKKMDKDETAADAKLAQEEVERPAEESAKTATMEAGEGNAGKMLDDEHTDAAKPAGEEVVIYVEIIAGQ